MSRKTPAKLAAASPAVSPAVIDGAVSSTQTVEHAVHPVAESLHLLDDIINIFGAVHAYTYSDAPNRFERPEGESLTVPGMVLSMHEIFSRFTRGLPVPITQGQYLEEDISAIDSMNKFELIDLQRKLRKSASDLRQSIVRDYNEQVRKEKEVQFNSKVDEEVRKALEKKESDSTSTK